MTPCICFDHFTLECSESTIDQRWFKWTGLLSDLNRRWKCHGLLGPVKGGKMKAGAAHLRLKRRSADRDGSDGYDGSSRC